MLNVSSPLTNSPQSATTTGAAIDLGPAKDYSLQYVAVAPAAGGAVTAVSAANDTATKAAHGWYTGTKVQATTTDGLPAGLATTTDYWLIKVDADTFQFATSLANALAGTAIDLTDAGTGTHTVTPTAGTIAHSLQLQKSNDGSNWMAEGSALAVAAVGTAFWEGAAKAYRYVRVVNTVTTGQVVYGLVLVTK